MQLTEDTYKIKYEQLQREHQRLQIYTVELKQLQEGLYNKYHLDLEVLRSELQQLKRLVFGSREERFLPTQNNPAQLRMDIRAEAVAELNINVAKKIEYTRLTKTGTVNKIAHPGRMKLPDHLERKEIILEPAGSLKGFKKIGDEITEELEYKPGKLFVNRYVRPKYVDQHGKTVVIAPMIDRPLPKAIAGPGLLAQIVIDKYVDHLPLHRQQQRFSRENINIPYSTITDWVTNTCKLIEPLYDALLKQVISSKYLHADESPIKVLDKDKKGQSHRGYFWVYHNSLDKLVLFNYQQGRGREGPVAMLKDFTGHLQTDGYAVYDIFNKKEDVILLHCMAHARRMFYEAMENDRSRAEHALKQIGLLYDIERKAKDQSLSYQQIAVLRKDEANPLLEKLGDWMKEQYVQVVPKSAIGKALGYSIQRWDQLMIYASDGKLNIDNNPVENCIRPVAIGRKNYLFAGSHEAAQRSAMLYSLLGTCKLNGINPFIWMKDVLQRISHHHVNKIQELLPHNWQPIP